MDMDSNAEEYQCQEGAAGEPSRDTQGSSVLESLAVDLENDPELPERRGLGTDKKEVSKHTLTLYHAPRALSFIFWSHPS